VASEGLPGWTELVGLLPPHLQPYAGYVYAGGCAVVAIVAFAGKVSETRKKRHEADEAKARAGKATIEREQAAGAGPALPARILAAQTLLQGQVITDAEQRLKLERFVVAFLTTGGAPPTASEATQIKKDVVALVTSEYPEERRALGLIADREAREGFALLLSEARAAQAASNVELAERFARTGRLAFFRDVGTAIEAFEAAVRLNPKDVDSRVRLARLLGKATRTAEARAHLENAVALADNSLDKTEARARLAERLFWSGGVGEAADAATAAITDAQGLVEQNPLGREQLALALTLAGRIALKQGNSTASAAYMRAAIAQARTLCAITDGADGPLRLSETLASASGAIRKAEGAAAGAQLALEATRIAREVATRPNAPPEAVNSVAVALLYYGDFVRASGDRLLALQSFEEALKLNEARAAKDPNDANAKRHVAVTLTKLGDLAASAGDRAIAEARFSEALKIVQARATADPKDGEAQRDVSLSLLRLGDLAASADDRATARARFSEALKIDQVRAVADPKNSEAQRDLSQSSLRLGELAARAGDRAMAKARYSEALKINEARAAADPKDSEAQRDVGVSLSKLGELAASADDRATAEARFSEALKINEARATLDPKDSQAQLDVSVNLSCLGDLAASADDRATAEARFAEALKIGQARAAADPKDAEAQAHVALSLGRVSELLEARGDRAGALENYEEAERLMAALVAKDSAHARWRNDRAWYGVQAKRLRRPEA
jgi:tetratricopeptide (TPR) repeat protein